jgi:hypothetical protein
VELIPYKYLPGCQIIADVESASWLHSAGEKRDLDILVGSRIQAASEFSFICNHQKAVALQAVYNRECCKCEESLTALPDDLRRIDAALKQLELNVPSKIEACRSLHYLATIPSGKKELHRKSGLIRKVMIATPLSERCLLSLLNRIGASSSHEEMQHALSMINKPLPPKEYDALIERYRKLINTPETSEKTLTRILDHLKYISESASSNTHFAALVDLLLNESKTVTSHRENVMELLATMYYDTESAISDIRKVQDILCKEMPNSKVKHESSGIVSNCETHQLCIHYPFDNRKICR